MRCENWTAGAQLPATRMPLLCTTDLARLASFYREAIGFGVLQQVPGVCVLLSRGSLQLQLWARRDAKAASRSRITLEPADGSIFRWYRELARQARSLLEPAAPRLAAWGAWEFALVDLDGNRLQFVQWECAAAERAAGEIGRKGGSATR